MSAALTMENIAEVELEGGKIKLTSSLLKFGERTKRVQDETVYMPSPTVNSKSQVIVHSDEELMKAFEEIEK